MDSSRYSSRGVSSDKAEVHAAIQQLDKGLFPYAFCKVLPDYLGGDPNYCNVMHADGAGTKSSLAYIYWRETGDLSVWTGIAKDALIMNLNDLMCAGITDGILVSSTIGRNKTLIPGEVIKALIEGTEMAVSELRSLGIQIHLTGGETADVGDLVRTVIVDSTVTARAPRISIIDNARIKPGLVIVGFASHGKATYEHEYNGGMASNGLTSARHDVFHHTYYQKYPESFDPAIDESLIYAGSRQLTEIIETPFGHVTAGKLVLSPTRHFLPLFHPNWNRWKDHIYGMIHCSGGGQTKILHFLKGASVHKKLPALPPLFRLIQSESGTPYREMLSTFNMGVLLEVYTTLDMAEDMITEAHKLGIQASIIGETLEPNPDWRLRCEVDGQPFVW